MKRKNNLYANIISIENLILASKKARKRKSRQKDVQRHIDNEKQDIENLHELLKHKKYRTSEYKVFKIKDPKERIIFRLPFIDRIVQHALMNVLEPIFVASFTADTYSCIKGRGIYKATMNLRKALNDVSNTKYCLKLDIQQFYPSICNDLLKQMLRKRFKDTDLLEMLDEIIDSTKGLPIGNYTSQILSNFYLNCFDHYVKEQLRVKYYFRYADDIVILNSNKEELHLIFKGVKNYLISLKLTVKNNYQIFPVEDRGIDFVGFVHRKDYTLLRKTIKKRYVKSKNKERWNSWLVHCNSINLRRKYERHENHAT